jgi:hypothetical protein
MTSESPRGKREQNLKKAEENRKLFEDTVRRMRARLDRTHLSSAAHKPLEKALMKLIRHGPAAFDVLNEEDYE